VWVTKYRYPILTGDIKVRCRDLLMQICDAEDVRILKGVVSKSCNTTCGWAVAFRRNITAINMGAPIGIFIDDPL
jgi:hypothetical protein